MKRKNLKYILVILSSLCFLIIINQIFNKKRELFGGEKQSKDSLNKTLIQITKDLNEYNLNNWFIGYGTLLGIVRENSCIDNDDDIDIIIDKNDLNKLHQLIKDKKYNYDRFNFENFVRIKLDNSTNYSPIDFYVANHKNCQYEDTWERVTWTNVCPLFKKEWNGVYLNLPDNYTEKLKNRYGDDWKTPRQWKGERKKKFL